MQINPNDKAIYEREFPNIINVGWIPKSPKTTFYNCIAWAAGETHRWWEPPNSFLAGTYWPPGIPEDHKIATYVSLYALLGYSVCDDGKFEQGHEKIALYAILGQDEVLHAARQLPSGHWTSKLGWGHDIIHKTPEALNSKKYGQPAKYLRRLKNASLSNKDQNATLVIART